MRFLAAVALGAVFGCAPTASRELCNGVDDDLDGVVDEAAAAEVVRLTIDSDVVASLATVHVTLNRAGEPVILAVMPPGGALPQSLDLLAPASGSLEIQVEGFDSESDRAIVSRTAIVRGFVPGVRTLALELETACLDADCGDGLTCIRGTCEAVEVVDASALPPADPEADRRAARLDCGERATCAEGDCYVAAELGGGDIEGVDLIVMVDNSNSMAGEQALLAEELPDFVSGLVTGDVEGDGTQDFPAVPSLHIGIVTSDMGAGPAVPPGETVPSCRDGLGDDGILRTVGVTSREGCAATYPPIFEFPGAITSSDAFARDVTCVAFMGTGGCGFEQQLEAVLKAVSVSAPTSATAADYVPPVFRVAGGTTTGHGDAANAGFLRDHSLLGVVILSDEEDCSVPDYSIFYRDPRFSSVGLNLRCFTFGSSVEDGALYPPSRYVDGLAGLRSSPSLVVFEAIVGVPADLDGAASAEAYDAVLADPRMIETPDPSASPPTRLLSSCRTADGGEAFPPRRIVAVASGLDQRGAHTAVHSICAEDFRPAIHDLARTIGSVFGGQCLPATPPADASGRSPCRMIELLPPGLACADRPGRTSLGSVRVGDVSVYRCEVEETGPGASRGWYLDPASENCIGAELVTFDDVGDDAQLVCPE